MDPFRGDDSPQAEYLRHPMARFLALEAAFDQTRSILGDRVPLRFAAVTLLLHPGEPADLVQSVMSRRDMLDEYWSWASDVTTPIRILIAAVLIKHGDEPAAFCHEVTRVRQLMRSAGMRRREIYETVAILAMRVRNGLEPITVDQVARMHAIYEAMKSHHWLLTGPEDFPACGFLVFQDATPEAIGQRANGIYRALHQRAKLWRGDPLQTASNVLTLGGLEPDEIADRFQRIADAFAAAGVRIGAQEYDEVATLCFLARPVDAIVETVVGYRARLRNELSWLDRHLAMSLATSLAFVRLVGQDVELGTLADAKTLLDMQTIVAARQAAAAAAAAGAA